MATHSSVLAWRIPGTGEPGGLPSMGSHRVGHGWSDLAAADSIVKSRDITLPTKVLLVKAMVFPVVMYGSECWTIKKAEHQRIDSFELWCWRRLLRGPWTARKSNQSILKKVSPEYSLEGLMLKLKLQYFGHLMRRTDSLEKTLMLGKIEGERRRGRQRVRWLDGITDSTDMSPFWVNAGSWWWTGSSGVLQSMGSQRVAHNWVHRPELNWSYPLRRNQDIAPRLHYCYLTALPLSPHLLPSSISKCLNMPFGTQGKLGRLNEAYFLSSRKGGEQTDADTERLLCPGAPLGPAWFQCGKSLRETLKGMSTHSSILAWKISWTEESGRLQSTGSQRVGQNWATSLLRSLSLYI